MSIKKIARLPNASFVTQSSAVHERDPLRSVTTENISEGAWEQLREGEDPELEMARV